MTSQVFKTAPSFELLKTFLKENAKFKKTKYIFSKASFKKAMLTDQICPFFHNLKENYYNSKRYYIERKITYKTVVTILRQICKFFHIPFASLIKYNKSSYEMEYHIIIQEQLPDVLL